MLVLLLLLLLFNQFSPGESETAKPQCRFTATTGFYAHVSSDLSIGDVVFKGSINPPDADMVVANIRSDSFNNTEWSDRLVVDRSNLSPGSYLLRVASSLSLPVYPSKIQEANLFVTVICNGYAYPLFTIHIDPTNRFAPQFYHEPYFVGIQKNLPVWSIIDTPVAAIDWDPSPNYDLDFKLQDSHKGIELMLDEPRKTSTELISGSGNWSNEQLPTVVRLKITGEYKLPISLRLTVSDKQEISRKSTTFIHLYDNSSVIMQTSKTTPTLPPVKLTTLAPTTTVVTTTVPQTTVPSTTVPSTTVPTTTQKSSTAAPTTTVSTNIVEVSSDIEQKEIAEMERRDMELLSKLKKTLTELVPKKTDENDDDINEQEIFRALGAKTKTVNAIETDELVANESPGSESSEWGNGETRFAQCSIRKSIMENSLKGTKVAHLDILNKTNTTVVKLIDPDETFELDESTDDIIISNSRLVDRELFSTLELVAEIENASPSTQCTRIRIYIDLEDENDNRPVFEAESYFFHVSAEFPPGKEIGKFVAQDIDQGANGQITYHLLTKDVPFQVGTQGKKGVLVSSNKLDSDIYMYNLTVEARDHGDGEVKSARVPVEVYVLGSKSRKIKQESEPEAESEKENDVGVEEVENDEETPEGSSTTLPTRQKPKAEGIKTSAGTTVEIEEDEEIEENKGEEAQETSTSPMGSSTNPETTERTAKTTTIITTTEAETTEDPTTESEPEPAEEEGSEMTNIDLFIQRQNQITKQKQSEKKEQKDIVKQNQNENELEEEVEEVEEVEEEVPELENEQQQEVVVLERKKAVTEPAARPDADPEIEAETTTTQGPLPVDEAESESDEPAPLEDQFAFSQANYTYDAFGMDLKENDVIGRISARPNPEFYAVDREVIGIVKVNDVGEILAGKGLNLNKDGPIKFGISATNGFNTTRAQVTIFRDANHDVMSSMPRFDQDVYRFKIKENQQPEVIGFVRAFHSALSSSESLRLTYSLIAPANIDELPFEIHPQSGEVSTSRPLDAEQHKLYRFQVRACLTQAICSNGRVIVDVEDMNDNSPIFTSRNYEANVESDVPTDTKIIRVYANDADSGNNSRITFNIIPESNEFSIHPTTGQIVTSQPLTQPLYVLLVDASDNGMPRRSDTSQVTVHVKGTNPSSPVFDQKEYSAIIPSPIRAGQVIGEVHASDPDPGNEGQITYKLVKLDNQDHRKFSINAKTGVVSAITSLTTEDGSIKLKIEASDNGANIKRKSETTLNVEIIEAKTLKFLPLPTTVYISTEKAVGSVVLRVSANSVDESNIKFRVLQDNSQFIMDGDLLRVANHLVEGESILSIRAETDSAHVDHQLKVVVMADRDKYPVFPQLTYDFDVSTDGHFPRVMHQFNAKLLNGTIRYTFFPPTPPTGFYLDDKTGELFVTSQFPDLKSRLETVFVVVRAVNTNYRKFYSDVGVAVTPVSSDQPIVKFQQTMYNFELYENMPVGGIVGTVKLTQPIGDSLKFSLSPESSFLGIHPNGSLFLVESVDAEIDDLIHDFTVTATDGDVVTKARVQVAIRDVNEFKPEFDDEEVEMSMKAGASPGTKIGRVVAHDKDVTEKNKLIYRIVGGSGRKLVFIQEDGTVIVGDEPIDRNTQEFDLYIEAVDRNGNHDQTHATVYIDVDSRELEEPPTFMNQPLIWNVTEGTTETYELQATGDSVRFKIIGGDPDGNFDIVHMPNRTARLRIISELDHRRQSSYVLQIEAREQRSQLTTIGEVVVNVADNNLHAPVFSENEYSGTVPIDIPIGFPIVTISATDIDRDPIQFSLQGESCESQLAIDSDGRVSYSTRQDQRTSGQFVCLVVASDGSHTSHANLRLKVVPSNIAIEAPKPNRPPVFEHEQYTFQIPSESENEIGTVKANDPENDPLTYSIEPTQLRNLFDVDSEGHIHLLAKLSDLEQPSYSFLVVAEDRGKPIMSSFTNVKISSQKEVTTTTTTERTMPTTSEPETDEQEDNEVSMATRNHENMEGSATTSSPVGRSRSTTKLPDIKFSQETYNWQTGDNLPIGSIVGQVEVNAEDPTIEYSFISADYLSIDREGRVAVIKPITADSVVNDVAIVTRNGEILAEARVFVAVPTTATTTTKAIITTSSTTTSTTTTAAPTTVSTTTTTTSTAATTTTTEATTSRRTTQHPPSILPVDIETQPTTRTQLETLRTLEPSFATSEVAPSSRVIPMEIVTTEMPTTKMTKFAFSQPNYFAFSTEGNYKSGIELEIKPQPLSTNNDPNEKVVYSIEDTTTKMPFFLTEDGKLVMFEADREKHSSYSFTIVARAVGNGSPDSERMARARMNVTILDVNDNYPIFDKHPEVIGVARTMHIGSPIYQMQARDLDEDSTINYEITPKHYFSIDPRDGLIRVLRDLREAPDDIEVVVVASDLGKPPLKSETKLLMRVFDDTTTVPKLPKQVGELIVGTSMVPGTTIKQIVAGPTVLENDKILYSLEDTVNNLFEIKDGGSLVLTRRPLDTEANKYHQLNITAENSKGSDWTIVNVFVEGRLGSSIPPTPPASSVVSCQFSQKVYRADVHENMPALTPVLRVQSTCHNSAQKFRYAFHHTNDEFDIDSRTGQITTKKPLDRETKSFYFLYVNVVEQNRMRRQSDAAVEDAASKLSDWQALVVVSILDENDNSPVFMHLQEDSTLSAVIDKNANLMTPVIHVQARDLDIQPSSLTFGLEGNAEGYFHVNSTNGLVQLVKSVQKTDKEQFELEVTVSDGTHFVNAPLNIYVLSVDTNVVQLTKDSPHGEIDPSSIERKLTDVLDVDTRILVAQPYVSDEGQTDPKRSHVFVYALEEPKKKPMERDELKSLLMSHSDELTPMQISSVSLLSTNSAGISSQTVITAVLIILLIALILFLLALIFCCIKRRAKNNNGIIEGSYMIDSTGSRPRPYDVENISRATAQNVLSSRQLPTPQEHHRELAVSPAFLPDSEVVVERDDTTKEFSNSVRERPSLIQSAIGRQKIHSINPNVIISDSQMPK